MRGVVVGKFSPLHNGHIWMIREAQKRCDELLIVSYSNPELEGCEIIRRINWLNTEFRDIRSVVLDPDIEPSMPLNTASDIEHQVYFATLMRRLEYKVDVLFCSESWGHKCASVMSEVLNREVRAEIIDEARERVSISATDIRNNPGLWKHYLTGHVDRTFVRRIGILGGESSGKTTLAHALADYHLTYSVSEHGRQVYVEKNGNLTEKDLLDIATEQIKNEQFWTCASRRYVFCDTTPLTTFGYSLWMFGRASAELEELSKRRYHGIILCAPDIPFDQDGTRRDEAFRMEQHLWYKEQLKNADYPVIEVHGTIRDRINQVDRLLEVV